MFTFTLPHKLGQAAAEARLKSHSEEPGWRTGATHQEWDAATHTIKTSLVTHIELPLLGRIKDVETKLEIVIHEYSEMVFGNCEPAWAERFVEPAVKHKLAEILA